MIEMIVAMAILGAIVAVVMLNTQADSPNDRARTDAAADVLYNLAQAIAGTEASRSASSFRQVIGGYPAKLSQLTTPIKGTDKEICGTSYLTTAPPSPPTPPGYTQKWTNPFYFRQLRTAGTIVAPGFTANDALVLITTPGSAGFNLAGVMAIRMPSVALIDAEALDLVVDGTLDGTKGVVRYNAAIDPASVDYYIYISGC